MKQRALTRGRIPGSGTAEPTESSATWRWAQAETDQLEALLEGGKKERGLCLTQQTTWAAGKPGEEQERPSASPVLRCICSRLLAPC